MSRIVVLPDASLFGAVQLKHHTDLILLVRGHRLIEFDVAELAFLMIRRADLFAYVFDHPLLAFVRTAKDGVADFALHGLPDLGILVGRNHTYRPVSSICGPQVIIR